jgi:NAD(P)H-binding
LGRVYDDKDVQERIVRNSKLDWVIVRPVILTDGPKTNTYRPNYCHQHQHSQLAR